MKRHVDELIEDALAHAGNRLKAVRRVIECRYNGVTISEATKQVAEQFEMTGTEAAQLVRDNWEYQEHQ